MRRLWTNLLLSLFISVFLCGQTSAAGNLFGDISDIAYDADTWNNNKQGASKNVIRDKFGTLSTSDIIAAISTKTGNYTITSSDLGKCIRMNSANDIVASLLSVGASDDGVMLRVAKIGAGKVVLKAADSDKLNDSGSGGTIYNDVVEETYAFIDLEYVHVITTWIATGTGTWVTTD